MDAKTLPTPPTENPEGVATGNESHYHSKKDRIFVRGIQASTA
jgi:hypothetical protein